MTTRQRTRQSSVHSLSIDLRRISGSILSSTELWWFLPHNPLFKRCMKAPTIHLHTAIVFMPFSHCLSLYVTQLTWICVNWFPYGLKWWANGINTVAIFIRKHGPFFLWGGFNVCKQWIVSQNWRCCWWIWPTTHPKLVPLWHLLVDNDIYQ